MKKLLLKYSGNTIYTLQNNGIDFASIKALLNEKGYNVVDYEDKEAFIQSLSENKDSEKHDNFLVIIDENQPSKNLIEHFNYLNLTVEWLLTILNTFMIGLCIYNKEKYMAYNKVFKNITHLTHEELKNTQIGTLLEDSEKNSFLENLYKCLNKEINHFTAELSINHNKPGERRCLFMGYPLIIDGNSLGLGYVLNEKDHNIDDPEEMRLNKIIIQELNQTFKLLNKVQCLDLNKIKEDTKEKIMNELAEDEPDYIRVKLSGREYEVLSLIYKGYTNQQIANELYISKRTVDFHRSNLLGKTNSRNTADLIRFAIKNHLIED